MQHYSRKRPVLPDSTPFLPDSKFSTVSVWHGDTVRTATAPSRETSHVADGLNDAASLSLAADGKRGMGSLSSLSSIRRAPTLSINQKYMSPTVLARSQTPGLPKITSSHSQIKEASFLAAGSSLAVTILDDALVDVELEKRAKEIESIKEGMQLVQSRTVTMRHNTEDIKEQIKKLEGDACLRQRNITKVASINMMLINTMESLQLQPDSDEGLTDIMLRYRAALLPEIHDRRDQDDKKTFAKLGVNDVYSINSRIRTCLVIMSREYFKSGKEVKVACEGYEALRVELKALEARNRSLQHDLDEIKKDEQSNISKQMMSKQLLQGVGFSVLEGRESIASQLSDRNELSNFDERLKQFRQRQTIDMEDSVILLRRLFSHIATCPPTLSTVSVGAHAVSKDLLDILRVSLICLYVTIPDKQGFLYKFTARSSRPDEIDIRGSNSLVKEVLKLGLPVRFNNVKEFVFDQEIDGAPGVIAHRVCSMPLQDQLTERCFGVVHVINKAGNDVFTSSDEMLLKVFVHHLETTLSLCNVYARTASQASLLDALVRGSVDLSSTIVLPTDSTDPPIGLGCNPLNALSTTGLGATPLQPAEILHALETITRDALKCFQVRAFLVTSHAIGMDPGELIYLDKSTCAGLCRHSASLDVTAVSVGSGIAGRVAVTMVR